MLVRGPSRRNLTRGPSFQVGSDGEDEVGIVPSKSTEIDCSGTERRKRLIVYHSSGIYQVSPSNGSYGLISNELWSRVKAAAYDNNNTIYVFHDGGIFQMSVDSGTYTTLSSEGWFATTAAVYAKGRLIVFHADGIFRVSTSNGSYEQISSEGWSRVKAAAYDNDNTINVFHDGGIFQVRVDNGSYKTLSWRGWSATMAAVYARNSLIVFSANGIFKVNASNGSYARISSEAWSRVRAVAYDDENTVNVFHDGGIFQVSIDNGSYTTLSREGWSSTKAAVFTKGTNSLDGELSQGSRAPPRKEKGSWGIWWAVLLVLVVLLWAEYGPAVAFKWKVLRGCLAIAAVLRLAMWSRRPRETPRASSPSARKGCNSASSDNGKDQFEETNDPMRWSFLPAGEGVLRANTRAPVEHEDDASKLKILAMHRPTHEPWREDMGNYPYSWHFSGRRRTWEIRIQVQFKRIPKGPLFFGIEMRYIPFNLSTMMKYMKNLLLKGMSAAIGGEIYQTPGENPAAVDGEPEPPTFAMPLWAIDQFHVANPGEQPDLTGDLEGMGLKRTSGLKKYIAALKAELESLSTEKVYTFCFWGISQFADAIHWQVQMAGFKLDASDLSGKPPVYVVLYEMPGVKPTDKDRRHLISRKSYFLKVAVWNAFKPFEEDEVAGMEIGGAIKGADSMITRDGENRRRASFGTMEWFACCGDRS